MAEKSYDVIVVGLGAMGSASLYQVAKRGLGVLGIDRYQPPHTLGSTHGPARVMRLAIGEGEHYTPLSMRSYELFRQIELETDRRLLEVTGMLVVSNIDKTKIIPECDFFENAVSAAGKFGIRHDVLNAEETRKRFPQFNVASDEKAYFEHEAGYLKPEECVRAQLSLAARLGARVQTNERVLKFESHKDGVSVQTERDTYHAGKLVLAAGPWLSDLLGTEHSRLLNVYRQVQYWFDVEPSFEDFRSGVFPIFFWQLPGVDRWIYGFPAIDGPGGGLLVSVPDLPGTVHPDSVGRAIDAEQSAAAYREYVHACFPSVPRKIIKTGTCLITCTPDSAFIIDKHPERANVIVCSACSGHGFKHSAAIGESIAEMIESDRTTIDLSAFSINRLLSHA